MTTEELEQHFYELPEQVKKMTQEEFDRHVEEISSVQGRRWQVLERFLSGYTDQEIAAKLRIELPTVRTHLSNVHKVLGLKEKGSRSYDLRMDLKALFWHFRQEMLLQRKTNDQLASAIEPPPPEDTSLAEGSQKPAELKNFEFIGRDRDLTNLANLRRKYKIVLIKAGAGVGKSLLAQELLQTQFQKVIRIEMGWHITPAEEKVEQILRKEFGEETSQDFGINLDILREKLADSANPIGVLIDNLESALDQNYRFQEKLRGYNALLAVLNDRSVSSFTLITSRRSLITPRARVYESLLEGLDITAWRAYFHDCDNAANSDALAQMRDAHNGNANAMYHTYSAIQNRFNGNIEAYWNRYKDALLADPALETLISVEMDWLKDNQPDAYNLLCRMGCYRYQDIKTVPWEGLICLLWDVPKNKQHCVIESLSKTSLVEEKYEYYLHSAVRTLAKSRLEANPTDWKEAHRRAGQYWDSTLSDASPQLYFNVFEAFYHYYTIEDFNEAFEVLRKKANNKIYSRNRYTYLRFWGYSSCLIDCFQKIVDYLDDIKKIHVIGSIGVCYYYSNQYELGIEFLEKCKSLIELQTDYRCQRLYCECLRYLANCNHFIGNSQKALDYCKVALEATKKIDKSKESDIEDSENFYLERVTSNIFQSLAYINYQLGKYNQSISNCEESLRWANVPDPENYLYREVGDALAIKSLNLYSQHKVHESLEIMGRAIDKFIKIEDYLSESYARCYLIRFYLETDLKAAEEQISSVKEIYNKGCKSSLLKADLYMSQAMYEFKIYQQEGQKKLCDQAIDYFLQCIEILLEIGVKPELAEAYFQLSLTYQAMGEREQAEEYKIKALEIFEQMEAPKQIERVNKAFELKRS